MTLPFHKRACGWFLLCMLLLPRLGLAQDAAQAYPLCAPVADGPAEPSAAPLQTLTIATAHATPVLLHSSAAVQWRALANSAPALESLHDAGKSLDANRFNERLGLLQPLPADSISETALAQLLLLPQQRRHIALTNAFNQTGVPLWQPELGGQEKKRVLINLRREAQKLAFQQVMAKNFVGTMMVLSGTNVGSSVALKPGLPHQLNRTRNCWAPLQTAAQSTGDAKDAQSEYAFNSDGFREVALLAERASAGRRCTATMIHPQYALTAVHCFTAKHDVLTLAQGILDRFRVLVPSDLVGTLPAARSTGGCFGDKNERCDFLVGTIVGTPTFLGTSTIKDMSFPGQTEPIGLPTPDLALIKMDFNTERKPNRIALLQSRTDFSRQSTQTRSTWLTRAGYGMSENSTVSTPNLGYWMIKDGNDLIFDSGEKERLILPHLNRHDSRVCPGDSGGPVFATHYSGTEPGSRILAAVISAVSGNVRNEEACKESPAELVQLIPQTVIHEICSLTNGKVCPPN